MDSIIILWDKEGENDSVFAKNTGVKFLDGEIKNWGTDWSTSRIETQVFYFYKWTNKQVHWKVLENDYILSWKGRHRRIGRKCCQSWHSKAHIKGKRENSTFTN